MRGQNNFKIVKRIILLFLLLILCECLYPQNLLPNPSFEDKLNCPFGFNQLNFAVDWTSPCTMSAPEYYNECNNSNNIVHVPNNIFGYEYARTGNAYSGLLSWGYSGDAREYIEAELIDSLKSGIKYRVSFYVSLADSQWYANSDMGAFLSLTYISDTTGHVLPYSPQIANDSSNPLTISTGWTLISDTFTAIGGEKFIVIGNFRNDINPDTIFVGGGANNPSYTSYYYVDDVTVIADSLTGINDYNISDKFKVYPNPARDEITVEHRQFLNGKKATIELFNIDGKKISSFALTDKEDKKLIPLNQYSPGLYLYKIIVDDVVVSINKLVIFK